MTGLKMFAIVPAYLGVTAILQTADTTTPFDFGFWFSQGLAVAVLCAVGIFFARQIWPEMRDFFKSILLEQREIKAAVQATATSILDLKDEVARSRQDHVEVQKALVEQCSLIHSTGDEIKIALTRANDKLSTAIEANTHEAETTRKEYVAALRHRPAKGDVMPSVTVEQVLAIIGQWTGNPAAKIAQWGSTYNFIIPPPPPSACVNDRTAAEWIAENYNRNGGPPLPQQ
jgi:hypothetical protein